MVARSMGGYHDAPSAGQQQCHVRGPNPTAGSHGPAQRLRRSPVALNLMPPSRSLLTAANLRCACPRYPALSNAMLLRGAEFVLGAPTNIAVRQ